MEMFDTVPPTHPSKKRPWTPPLDTASWHLTTPHSTRTPFHISTAHQQDIPSTAPPHTSTDHRTHTSLSMLHSLVDPFLHCAKSHDVPSTQHRKPVQRQPCAQTSYTFHSANAATTCSELVQVKWSIVTPGVTWEEVGGNSRRKALGGNTSRQPASVALLVGVHVVQAHENVVVTALLVGSHPE